MRRVTETTRFGLDPIQACDLNGSSERPQPLSPEAGVDRSLDSADFGVATCVGREVTVLVRPQ